MCVINRGKKIEFKAEIIHLELIHRFHFKCTARSVVPHWSIILHCTAFCQYRIEIRVDIFFCIHVGIQHYCIAIEEKAFIVQFRDTEHNKGRNTTFSG